jgi:prepilin-type N-terminal cleavage/methylation domain-containing protein
MHKTTSFRPMHQRQKGFTLLELMVVLVIVAGLAALVGPRFFGQLDGARSKTARVQIADFEKSLELFKLDVGRFPTREEGLPSLVTAPAGATVRPRLSDIERELAEIEERRAQLMRAREETAARVSIGVAFDRRRCCLRITALLCRNAGLPQQLQLHEYAKSVL